MFRRTLQRLLLPLGSFKKTNFPNHSPLQNYRQYGKHNKRQNQQSLMPKILISGGILGWLGVEKQPEKVDENHKASQELIQTIQLGVRAVQVSNFSKIFHPCLDKTFGLTFLPKKYIQCISTCVIHGMIRNHF